MLVDHYPTDKPESQSVLVHADEVLITLTASDEDGNSAKKLSKPMFIVRWNNLLQFKQGYLANVDMNWRGAGDSENVHLGQTWSLNMGITKQYGKHWNVKLALNDIFNTSKKSEFTIYSGVSDVQMTKISTTRNIECTIRYNFNATKSKYAGKGAGKDEKNRL